MEVNQRGIIAMGQLNYSNLQSYMRIVLYTCTWLFLILETAVATPWNKKENSVMQSECKTGTSATFYQCLPPEPTSVNNKKRQRGSKLSLLASLICGRLWWTDKDTKSSQANFPSCNHCNSLLRQGCTEKRKAINPWELSWLKETTGMEQKRNNKDLRRNHADW